MRRNRVKVLLTILMLPLAFAGFVRVVRGNPGSDVTCAECRIEVEQIATVGENAGPLAPLSHTQLSMNSRGEFTIGTAYDNARVVIYNADGTVKRSWGRSGKGPGEFRHINAVTWLSDDTLLIVDGSNQRYSVWLSDSTLVREGEFKEYASSMWLRRDGAALLHRSNPAGRPSRAPFVIRHIDGTIVEFGEVRAGNERENTRLNSLKAAVTPTDSLVVAGYDDYRAQVYTPDGTLPRTIDREPRWFHPPRYSLSGVATTLIRGRMHAIEAVGADDEGRFLFATSQVDPIRLAKREEEFRAAERARNPGRRENRPLPPSESKGVVQLVLEVVDPDGKAIAARVLDGLLFGGFVNGTHFWTVRDLEDGQIVFDVWRFRLVKG